MKILILYASYGDGHLQVSRALQQSFSRQGINQVMLVDLFAEAHPVLTTVTRYVYLKSSLLSPDIYGWSFYLTQNMQYDRRPVKWLNSLGIRKLKEILEDKRPAAVINTFPMLAMPELRKHGGTAIPTFTVLTDYSLHQRWIHPEIDKFYVATEDLKRTMVERGIHPERIKVSGIPLREAFGKPLNSDSVFRYYGIDPSKKIVLVMAGAYGILQNLKKMGKALLSLNEIELVFVCGKNKALQESMEACYADEPRMHIRGFVDHIHELMAASSCIVTKAGGITLSEAIAVNLPIIVYRPLPGQEKENARYLAEKGAALIVRHLEELVERVKQLLTEEGRTQAIKQALRSLRTKDASDAVAADIINEIEQWKKIGVGAMKENGGKVAEVWTF